MLDKYPVLLFNMGIYFFDHSVDNLWGIRYGLVHMHDVSHRFWVECNGTCVLEVQGEHHVPTNPKRLQCFGFPHSAYDNCHRNHSVWYIPAWRKTLLNLPLELVPESCGGGFVVGVSLGILADGA